MLTDIHEKVIKRFTLVTVEGKATVVISDGKFFLFHTKNIGNHTNMKSIP